MVGQEQATSNRVAREGLKGSNFEELGEQCSEQRNWKRQSPLGLDFVERETRRVWLVFGNITIMSFNWLQRWVCFVPSQVCLCHRLHSIRVLLHQYSPQGTLEQATRNGTPLDRAILWTHLTCYPSTRSYSKPQLSDNQRGKQFYGLT